MFRSEVLNSCPGPSRQGLRPEAEPSPQTHILNLAILMPPLCANSRAHLLSVSVTTVTVFCYWCRCEVTSSSSKRRFRKTTCKFAKALRDDFFLNSARYSARIMDCLFSDLSTAELMNSPPRDTKNLGHERIAFRHCQKSMTTFRKVPSAAAI